MPSPAMFIAASAGAPHSGSITSSGPPSGNAPRKVSSRSPSPSSTTASAPSSPARASRAAVAAGRHDAARAQQPRRLHGHQPDGAGRTEHEHPVGALQLAGLHRVPAGHAGDAAGRGGDVVVAVRQHPQVGLVGDEPLRHRAGGLQRLHARAGRQRRALDHAAHALAAGDERRIRPVAVEAPAGDRQVDRVQPGRAHLDQRLALAALRLRPALLDPRVGAVLVDDQRAHQ